MTATTEYYTISDERAEQIARAAGVGVERVREIALADWNEGDEHQQWLDSAPVAEVASWLASVEAE